MTPERLEQIRGLLSTYEDQSDGWPRFDDLAKELLAAYEALASRKVIHEETRRVFQFKDGGYVEHFRWGANRSFINGYEKTVDPLYAECIPSDSYGEDYLSDKDDDAEVAAGCFVRIRILVEEVPNG